MRSELERLVRVEATAALVMAGVASAVEEGEAQAQEQTRQQQQHLWLSPLNEQTEVTFIAVKTPSPLMTQIIPPITLLVILHDLHHQNLLRILLKLLWLRLVLLLSLRNPLLRPYGTHSRVESRMTLRQCPRSTTRRILYSRIRLIGLRLLWLTLHPPRHTARRL